VAESDRWCRYHSLRRPAGLALRYIGQTRTSCSFSQLRLTHSALYAGGLSAGPQMRPEMNTLNNSCRFITEVHMKESGRSLSTPGHHHAVRFYENDKSLAHIVAKFLS